MDKIVKYSDTLTFIANGTLPGPFTNNSPVPQKFAKDFKNLAVTLIGSNTAAFTVRIKGSRQENPVDFTVASSLGNSWGYIQTVNSDSGSPVAGSTGYTFAANGTTQAELNTDVLTWVAIEVSGYATGQLDAFFTYTNNV